ncbi:hypothetical protein OESDEN_04756 [Oesophagostomum dentatum]|uniref:Uncharacterized protein n=1 Tax=Oesophagostomum dentatum TaxID=61180 RepID=A0A0B1THK2_OESDE|nr:hypothetical protein OESDEN_04756 [Oesophagostomum dentatum]
MDDFKHPALGSEQAAMLNEAADLALSDDSCDPSDVEEGETKKVPDDSYMTGLEPENDSDEEDTNMSAPSATFKTMKNDAKTDSKCVRKSSRQSTVLLRPSKVYSIVFLMLCY